MRRIIMIFSRFLLLMLLFTIIACEQKTLDNSVILDATATKTQIEPVLKIEALYVGGTSCVGCHQTEAAQWQGSHHDLAMQPANSMTVLGDFNNATFFQPDLPIKNQQPMARFFKKADEFWIETSNTKGQLQEYQVLYTFGVYPLQQYLLNYGSGQLQAFSVAWDSRPSAEGGQRWFFLYEESISATDPLHWTQFSQNWNRRCAACHSTGYEKGYSEDTKNYHPKWVDINVNCEACHGPGSEHIAWTKNKKSSDKNKGLIVSLNSENQWLRDNDKPVASRIEGIENQQVEQCATCHSRRSEQAAPAAGRFHDWLLLQTIAPNYYWSDGQVRDEVFVTGSFMQSKMYQAGVVCSDCHNPHSLKLKIEGNGLRLQCHSATTYNVDTHHHHEGFKQGSACVDCHMPETTYMGVDNRRDHKFFTPKPSVSQTTGAPNACNRCHVKESAEWSESHLQQWGVSSDNVSDTTHAFSLAFKGEVNAVNDLLSLYNKSTTSDFLKASILRLLNDYPGAFNPENIIAEGVLHNNPSIRREAAALLVMLPANKRLQWKRLLEDSFYVVRYEALQAFADIPQAWALEAYQQVEREYLQAATYHSDEPGTLANLAGYWQKKGQFAKAENNYKKALQLDAHFYFALINSADLYRIIGEEEKAVAQLQRAIEVEPNNAQAYFALGLSYVRQQQKEQGLEYLKQAVDIEQQDQYKAHYIYVYSIGLWDLGKQEQAILLLSDAVQKYSYQPLASLLANYQQQMH